MKTSEGQNVGWFFLDEAREARLRFNITFYVALLLYFKVLERYKFCSLLIVLVVEVLEVEFFELCCSVVPYSSG